MEGEGEEIGASSSTRLSALVRPFRPCLCLSPAHCSLLSAVFLGVVSSRTDASSNSFLSRIGSGTARLNFPQIDAVLRTCNSKRGATSPNVETDDGARGRAPRSLVSSPPPAERADSAQKKIDDMKSSSYYAPKQLFSPFLRSPRRSSGRPARLFLPPHLHAIPLFRSCFVILSEAGKGGREGRKEGKSTVASAEEKGRKEGEMRMR